MANEDSKETEEKKPSLIKKLMLPLLLSVVVAGGGFGALTYFGVISLNSEAEVAENMEGEEGAGGAEDDSGMGDKAGMPAFFFTLYPDMLITLNKGKGSHYLKVTIDVMSRDEAVVAGVEQYHPIIRNNLLKLFQEVEYELAASPEGLEALQTMAAEEVRRVLKQYHGPSAIEGVYFTSFVVQ